ncbi:pilus assembly protein TadG-related protein [Ornithinimicrobium sp. Y1694]|uniref:pilus assembly protein TadG-related protein n=1 Tax=Ornithinimicrobium sp. Y1694 TaxID=3418590 RepID=UPI003CE9CD7F
MQRLIVQLRDRKEDGASAVLVAVCMLMLIAFTGLGVDVTSAYAKSQEVQNAADAGALAAAQKCAESDVTCSAGSQSGMATDLAVQNVRLETNRVQASDTYPASNRVTVSVTAEHQNFFAAAFGFTSFTVVREATAQWDSPKKGPAMLPLTISACSFYNQTTGQPNLGSNVTVYMPNTNNGNGSGPKPADCPNKTYPPGGFGWLDTDSSCQSHFDPVVGDYYEVGSNPGNAAQQCLRNKLPTLLNEVVILPIFSDKQGTGENAKFLVDRFAAFKIKGFFVQSGNVEGGIPCGPTPLPTNAYTKTCLIGTFVDWVELGDDYSGGVPTTEVSVIRLIDPKHPPTS